MSHSPSRHKRDLHAAAQARQAAQERAAETARVNARARRIVALWNDLAKGGRPPPYYPTITTTIGGGRPLLKYLCPGCRQFGTLDLRTARRHPHAPISSLIPALSCTRCCPNPPFAVLVELSRIDGAE